MHLKSSHIVKSSSAEASLQLVWMCAWVPLILRGKIPLRLHLNRCLTFLCMLFGDSLQLDSKSENQLCMFL